MKRFQLIEHTADTGIVAAGKDIVEAFANAGYGLFSIIADLRRVRSSDSRTIEAAGHDIESLLFDWMSQLVFLFDAEHFICKKFEITEFTARSLKAVCRGEKFDPARHHIKIGVKAPTYHMLEVDRVGNKVRVIFDV